MPRGWEGPRCLSGPGACQGPSASWCPPPPTRPPPSTRPPSAPRSARKERGSGSGGEDLLCDADAIFTVQKLRMANPGIEIFTELTSPASMAFLSPTMPFKGLGDVSPFLLPPYTSGQVGGVFVICIAHHE